MTPISALSFFSQELGKAGYILGDAEGITVQAGCRSIETRRKNSAPPYTWLVQKLQPYGHST